MNDVLVMKFGGTSMGSAERIRVAADICIEQQKKRPVVAVVSAMSKITDLLLDSMRKAEAGDESGLDYNLHKLRERHQECCAELLDARHRAEALTGLDAYLSDFRRICHGIRILGERPPRSVDDAVSIGEKLSALLITEYLATVGVRAAAVSGSDVIVTDAVFGNASPLAEETRRRASAKLAPMLAEGCMPVVTGFNGATMDGRPTTLGRGGSDFSASILAGALDATELWIWTDVDGIMSADPRLVPDARVLEEVTYAEAAELAYNGAKVLHPRTLAPLVEKRIPVWSKNSFNLAAPGTRIVPITAVTPGPRAVTSMTGVVLISIEPANATISGTRVMARALESLAAANAEVLAFSSSSYRQSFCFLVRQEELEPVLENLESSFAIELAHGYLKPVDVDDSVALLAVVGEGMRGTPGLAGRIFMAISRQNVNIIAIAQGSSELTISIVVHRDGLERAIRAIHTECGMSQGAAAGGI
ncbi:MAG TPA: aspartate kinase [Bryobacteraceae bacterium]|nr:aspartate kinase [Bryobacteraceae bacterium]